MSTKLMRIQTLAQCAAMALLVAAATSCGDVVRSNRSPVILVVSSLQAARGNATTLGSTLSSDVVTLVRTPAPCSATAPCSTIFGDNGSVSLIGAMKDATVSPTTNNSVTITGYHVEYRRTDGRNTPGVDVPFGFDGGVTGLVIPGGTATSIGFVIVRNAAKEESPLLQLRTSPDSLSTIADVTFYGRDVVGNELSATGSILITFADFGD